MIGNQRWFVDLTTRCNGSCSGCFRRHLAASKRRLDIDASHLKRIPQNVSVSLHSPFGDPIFHPDVLNIIEANKWRRVSIHTNGTAHGKDFWSSLAHVMRYNQNNFVVFALDGLEDTFKIYRKHLSFRKLISNIRHFTQAGGNAFAQVIEFEHLKNQIEDIKQLALDIGCKKIFMKKERKTPPKNSEVICQSVNLDMYWLGVDGIIYPCCPIYLSRMIKGEKSQYGGFTTSTDSTGIKYFREHYKTVKLCQGQCSFDHFENYKWSSE